MKLALIILSTLLTGCGADSGKSFFSAWSGQTSGFVLDLSTAQFGSSQMTWQLNGGEQCVSTVVIGGTEEEGSAVIGNTTYVANTGSGSDPGCASIAGSVTFTKTATTLTICGETCEEYI